MALVLHGTGDPGVFQSGNPGLKRVWITGVVPTGNYSTEPSACAQALMRRGPGTPVLLHLTLLSTGESFSQGFHLGQSCSLPGWAVLVSWPKWAGCTSVPPQ